MLRIMSDEDRLIEDADIQWYYKADLLKNKAAYNFYITTDFATSEKASADFSVISVWAINHKGMVFYVDGICRKQLLDKSIDDLFIMCQRYNPMSVGIEVTGQQGGFVQWIKQEMMERNVFFNIASANNNSTPGIRPVSDKFGRFLLVTPWFKQQLIHFPLELKSSPMLVEGLNELSLAAKGGFKSKHDDFLDTISMLMQLNMWRPSSSSSLEYNDTSGVWEDLNSTDQDGYSIDSYIV